MLLHDVIAQPDQNYLMVRNVSDEQYRIEIIPQPSKYLYVISRQMEQSPDEDTEGMYQSSEDEYSSEDSDDSHELRILCLRFKGLF